MSRVRPNRNGRGLTSRPPREVALATAINWGSAYLVSQFFLSLVGAIGNSMTFWLFALFCVIGWTWIYFAVPESKHQSLEQIQKLWTQRLWPRFLI